jgi:hypothetical protein
METKDVLGVIVPFLAFIASVIAIVFSWLAVKRSHIANKIAEESNKIAKSANNILKADSFRCQMRDMEERIEKYETENKHDAANMARIIMFDLIGDFVADVCSDDVLHKEFVRKFDDYKQLFPNSNEQVANVTQFFDTKIKQSRLKKENASHTQ